MMPCKDKYYFDYAATCPVDEEVLEAYLKIMKTHYYNSESMYDGGIATHKLVEKSRSKIASLLQVDANEILFTSGASEANSLAIKGYALKNQHKGKHIITSKMEHASVHNSIKQLVNEFGFEVSYLPVNMHGKVCLEDVKKVIKDTTILVCIMSVNNETGAIQDVEAIGEYLQKHPRIAFMCDGVQSIGKIPVNLKWVDLFTFTTHKLYGLKGCGILVKKKNIEILPLVQGGMQEHQLRGGTLNAPTCIVAAKTVRKALESREGNYSKVQTMHTYLLESLKKMEGIDVNASTYAVPYIINFSCLWMNSEIMMNALNERNIYVASQSACSSKSKQPSRTLQAMKLDDVHTYGAIRISLSHRTTMEEIKYLIEMIEEILHEYRV